MWATLEIWIVASFSMMPPGWPAAGRVWRFIMLTPWTSTRSSSRTTRSTSPLLPLSRPVMTITLSPFLILNFAAMSEHLGRERDDLHEFAGAQLAGHRPEDARADRLALLGDEHGRVAVEADRAAVGAANLLGRADDDRLMHVALLDAAARDRLLDRDDDHVAHGRRLALRAAQHLDALDATRPRIVGDVEIGLHLDHDGSPLGGGSRSGGLFGLGAARFGTPPRGGFPGGRRRRGFAVGGRGIRRYDDPTLPFGDRTALLDAHDVARLEDVVLVMRRVFLRAHDEFLVDGVHDTPLDAHDHGLVARILHGHTLQYTLRHFSALSLGPRAFGQNGLDAGDVAPHLTHPRRVLELAARPLEAQIEPLLGELIKLALELVVGLCAHVAGLHGFASTSPARTTTRVAIDSFAAARPKASRAIGPGTPSSSNMMRPGLTRQTQNSGVPLPDPMRTSAGFTDTGTSGKMRIQTRPMRLMWRVMARRAASISRAVTRPGSVAFRPKLPKLSAVPPLARPWMRPLCALRYLVRLGESMTLVSSLLGARLLLLGRALVLRHRVVRQHLAFEDPDLDAAGAIGGLGRAVAEIDFGAQRVERHAPLAIPFHARDLGAAQAPRAVDADAECAQTHRRLHGALHGAAEGDTALELLGDAVGDQLGIDLGFPDLEDVEAHLAVGHLGDVEAQLLDVRALLADDHARTRRMDGDARLLGGALDDDPAHPRLLQTVVQELPEPQILVQQPAIFLAREPARIPGAVDAEAQADRIDLLTHQAVSSVRSSRSRTITVRLAKYFSTCAARPRPRAWKRFKVKARPTDASLT